MSLDLDDHLLEAVDGLVAAFLGDLLLDVASTALSVLTSTVLSFLGNVLASSLMKLVGTVLSALGSVNSRVATITLVTGSKIGCIGRVAGASGVSNLGCVTKGASGLLSAERLLLVILGLGLVLKVLLGEIRNIVPGVVLGGSVNLVELLIGGVDLVSRLLSGITGHVSEEDRGIAHWCTC